jgi:hypothetical protein
MPKSGWRWPGSLAAKANGTAIQTPDPTFSKATRGSTGQPPGAAEVRIHLRATGRPAGNLDRHATSLKGAQTRSCSSPVFVQETAEEVASVHSAPVIRARDGQLGRRRWRLQSECPVRTVGVVVLDICPKDLRQMATSDNQQPVQALGADRADPPFRVRIRSGRLDRCHQHLPTLGAEHLVEAPGEFRVAVAQQGSASVVLARPARAGGCGPAA